MDARLAILLLLLVMTLVALMLPVRPEPPSTLEELAERQRQIDHANHLEML